MQSHVVGSKSGSLIEKTIPQILEETASNSAKQEAAVFHETGERWTYSEFRDRVHELARGLLGLGLTKGDRLGIWAPNRAEWVLTQFASAEIGLVLVTINPGYRADELAYALRKVQCKAVICASTFKSSNYVEMLQAVAPELSNCQPGQLKSQALPDLKTVIVMAEKAPAGTFSFGQVQQMGREASDDRRAEICSTLSAHDPINIQFTSGTTGAPKGATLTHYGIVNNANTVTDVIALSNDDRLCIPVPLYHCFGMVLGTLGCVVKGATMLFPGESFEAESVLSCIAVEKATALYGVPTMFLALLDHPNFQKDSVVSLRTGIMAGAPCPIELMKRVVGELHVPEVTIAYGMTETSPISFQTRREDPLEMRVSTVGRIIDDIETKICGQDGETVPTGERGELFVRGYSVMKGYWNDLEKTKEAVDDAGWLRTGDLATLDEAGYCRIVGRVKDMVIRGGENIYPREIEEFLFSHPDIKDVQVFGVPDEKFGEQVCAWVVLHDDATMTEVDLRAYCKGNIAHFKIPHYVRFKSDLPVTVTGKPQKFVMRDEMIAELGLS